MLKCSHHSYCLYLERYDMHLKLVLQVHVAQLRSINASIYQGHASRRMCVCVKRGKEEL